MDNKKKAKGNFIFFVIIGVLMAGIAGAVSWVGNDINYTVFEDTNYYHNLSANISGPVEDMVFSIDNTGGIKIFWNDTEVNLSSISQWIFISDSLAGTLTINASRDNQTGFFGIPIKVAYNNGKDAITTSFYFNVSAVNDVPNFTAINNQYTLVQNQNFLRFINASDEESHYPLRFNIVFFNNCTHASWSNRNQGENCSLSDLGFNLTNFSNTSALMNFTPSRNDVGVYWANITVTDFGENYTCSSYPYCESGYSSNKTSETFLTVFTVSSSLEINISDCNNSVWDEADTLLCQINITTTLQNDLLNIWSNASIPYVSSGYNQSWFYLLNQTFAENFAKTVQINISLNKSHVGNWIINFSVLDLNASNLKSGQIYIYINRSVQENVSFSAINNVNTSINSLTSINLTAYDNDLLIPDKYESDGWGYNESISFYPEILKDGEQSDLFSILNIINFQTVGNSTTAQIVFTPNSSQDGEYTINITAKDKNNQSIDSKGFTLIILSNDYPYWNNANYSFNLNTSNNLSVVELFRFYRNLTNASEDIYANDSLGDMPYLLFTNSTGAPPYFNLTSNGIINFVPYKQDVGFWTFNLTVNDKYSLSNTTSVVFNISNNNSAPWIDASSILENEKTVNEGSSLSIDVSIFDEDFKIGQKSFYDENLTVVTIISPNSFRDSPVNFSFVLSIPADSGSNLTIWEATFVPQKANVGNYNVTINVSDKSNASYQILFNLTIIELNNNPILSSLANQTSAVGRDFYYRVNASDIEDGNSSDSGNNNFTFSYAFLIGADFLNSTTFNSTTGEINITFNSTISGIFCLNMSVNDSGISGIGVKSDSEEFCIFVYGFPEIILPDSGVLNFSENSTANFTVLANHSVADSLVYELWIDNIIYNGSSFVYSNLTLRNITTSFGNKTNFSFYFSLNFSDESYGLLKNATLIVYPANTNLSNNSEINSTLNFFVNVSHENYPITFFNQIDNRSGGSPVSITLLQYFKDSDFNDIYYNQTVGFTYSTVLGGDGVSVSISNWTRDSEPEISFSSSSSSSGVYSITAFEYELSQIVRNSTSNSFNITLNPPQQVQVPSSGGGGRTKPVPLKIIVPNPTSLYKKGTIILPISLVNEGTINLYDVFLNGSIAKDGVIRNDFILSFDKFYFNSLSAGKWENISLTIDADTTEVGQYEINLNAVSKSPSYKDNAKIYLTVYESNQTDALEKILFIEELIAENPQCLEIQEIVNEARKLYNERNYDGALEKAREAIESCKSAVLQQSLPRKSEGSEQVIYKYFAFTSIALILLGPLYYFYKRNKLKRF